MDKAAKAAALKKRRADYFTERAALMDPPIDAETLQQCASYKTAVASPHEPTQRSWVILRPKLEEERLAIEANRYGRKLWENVEPMIKRRALNDSSEQRCVLSLADAVIEQVMNSPVTVANEDLVLLILQRVYDAYQECGEKPAGMFGEHRLIMDDARMIYYTKIVPRLARLSRRGRSMEDATMFRCPGCPESIDIVNTDDDDSDEENTRILPRYRSFASHYKHILTKHSHEEDFSCFLPYRVTVVPGYKRTLWMCLEWPQRLPILASHEISDGHWDPQEELEFENIPHNGVSIDGPAPSEFIPSLFYAAIKLQDVDIDSKTRAAMIIHFAGARWEFSAIKEEGITRNVPEYYLKHMREALRFCKKHCDIEGLFDGFLCGQCHAAPGPHGYKFEDLSTHYLECHDVKVWAKRMFDFNGIESLPTLQKRLGDPADNPTARALLELFPRLT